MDVWASNNLFGVTYGNGIYVTVGDSGILLTSSDGISWSSIHSGGSSEPLKDVTCGNNIFAIVGDGGVIRTSSDGNTWTSRTSGTSKNLLGSHIYTIKEWFRIRENSQSFKLE